MLERACASVRAQTDTPVTHLVGVDYAHDGPAGVRNQLAEAARTEWLAFLDDDDHLDPEHLATLGRFPNLDVVYPDCRFDGPPLPDAHLPRPFDRAYLAQRGFIPITFLVRRDIFWKVGGFDLTARYEDWSMLNKIADAGGTFGFVPEQTWTYCTAHKDRRTNLKP